MERLTVYCGSSVGADPRYQAAAATLGATLAARGIGLVFGGGRVGLMGVLADAVLARGGTAIGVIPHALAARELAHEGLTELHVVSDMHQRKALMAELGEAFVALPGGLGTFEELFEILTWAQLGLHAKPVGVLDAAEFFGPLVALLEHTVAAGFVARAHAERLVIAADPEELLERLIRAQVG